MKKNIYVAPSTKVIGIDVSMLQSVSKEDYTKGSNLDSREADKFDWDADDDESEEW